ncbi:suppressor of lurcher protein 1-like isoform X2 [Planococcus citri]|uniref:suppressor of lurcher protein 1-like isoform X2 n=1 Tax=Planococcus citri TaxID=170843 RepID=UPI0031F7DCCA
MDYTVMITLIFVQVIVDEVENEVSPRCECLTYTKTFGKEFGTFNSPDYPYPYPPSIDCLLYTFVADAKEIVEITFKDFNVHKANSRCMDSDYLKVYAHDEDGKINEYTQWDSVLCGRYPDIPHVLYSSVPALVLQFHSGNKSNNCTGFIGTFRFLDKRIFETDGRQISGTTCDQQFESGNSSQQGRFYSPRYPASYPRSIRCFYHFKARPEERIKLVFEELMFQKGDDSCINREDIIKVFDGYNVASPNILLLCNELTQVEIFSTGPNLYVEFIANDHWPGQGFKATYYFQHVNELQNFNEIQQEDFRRNLRGNSHNTLQRSSSSNDKLLSDSCDIYIRSTESRNGSFTSPLYPRPYPGNSRCLFVFQAHGRERIQITFEDLNLYYNSKEPKVCSGTDSIVIYGKIEGRMEKIMTLCGTDTSLPVMSSGPILALEFLGFYSSAYSKGFKAFYNFIENFGITTGEQLSILPCAFQYNSTSVNDVRTFTSPNFPGLYPRNTECHYFFYGRPKEKIRIKFTYFDVEGVLPCDEHSESDYVEFSNYMAHDINFARHCGNLSSFSVSSIGNFFRVSFKSNNVLDGSGFRATYQFLNDSSTREKISNPNLAHTRKPQDIFLLQAFLLLLTQSVTNLQIISNIFKRLML